MRRVLFVANLFPPDYTGGAEVINYHTARGLLQRGLDVSMLVVNGRMARAVDERYDLDGIPIHRRTYEAGRRNALRDTIDLRVYRTVAREIRQVRPDLVHIHNVSGASLAVFLACRVARVPVVATLHDLWLLCPNNMLYRADGSLCDPALDPKGCRRCFRQYDFWADIPHRRALFRALTSNTRLFVSPSRALVHLHVAAGYDGHRFRVVPHGLGEAAAGDPSNWEVEAQAAQNGYGPTILFAGGGTEIKGASVLIQALPTLLRCMKGLRVIVAGGGEERLLARFREMAPQVVVLGWVPFERMGRLLESVDLVLVPSTCPESFSLVTLESLQMGTPVVASNLGGLPELVRDGETGYLIPTGDSAALTERVILHFARPAFVRRQMRGRCVESVSDRLTLAAHVDGILRVYQEAVGDPCVSCT